MKKKNKEKEKIKKKRKEREHLREWINREEKIDVKKLKNYKTTT